MQNEQLDFISAARKLISIDSTPHSTTVEIVSYLQSLCECFGLHCEVQEEIQNGVVQSNIIIRTSQNTKGESEFLLQTHLDTVDPGNFALWKKNNFNPFDAVIDENKIYGIGAAEVKLDFLCKLQTLIQYKSKDFKSLKPVLVGTFGEETGMQGVLKLIRKNKIFAKYALVGEPSDFQIINAAKGYATVEIRIPFSEEEIEYKKIKSLSESTSTQTKIFSGKTAHSSTPHLGESAAVKLFEYLSKMPENIVVVDVDAGTRYNMIPHQAMVELDVTTSFQDPAINKINHIYRTLNSVQSQMQEVVDRDFVPVHSTMTVGIMRTFEDHILIGGSCRILPNVSQEYYEKWMNEISEACNTVGAEFRLQDYKRPFRTNENSVLVKAAVSEFEKMGISSRCISLASTNEASLLSRVGIECICVGAGIREGNVHTGNEHVNINDLNKMTEFYSRMVERFCL